MSEMREMLETKKKKILDFEVKRINLGKYTHVMGLLAHTMMLMCATYVSNEPLITGSWCSVCHMTRYVGTLHRSC